MVGLLGEILPIGLVLALGPTRIISTMLLLTSTQPIRNALACLSGVAGIYLAVSLLALLFFGRTLSDIIAGTIFFDMILVVAGIGLLVVAARSLVMAPTSDTLPSRWMQRLTSISPAQAFLVGMILACSVQSLVIFLSGVILIYETGLSLGQRVIALLVLVTLTLLCQVIPIALYAANARRARARLTTLMERLNRHNRVIMTTFSLLLGVIFLVAGMRGLIPVIHSVL
jgi:Sap, sulfolipid-1-addressing protein